MKILLILNLSLLTLLTGICMLPGRSIVWKYEPVVVRAIITAYSKEETCPHEECITASGKVATTGFVACPRAVKLGTTIEILGKEYECADRTSLKYDGRYDIWHDNYSEAKEFGIKNLEIVINPPLP